MSLVQKSDSKIATEIMMHDEKDKGTNLLQSILNHEDRRDVTFSMSVQNVSISADNTLHLLLEIKFRYKYETLSYLTSKENIPDKHIKSIRRETGRFFPFSIFNAVEEKQVGWTYQYDEDKDEVFEQIDIYTRITYVRFDRYFPFVIELVPIKICSNGTFKTGLINLRPGGIDFEALIKETSPVRVDRENAERRNERTSDIFCKMVIRDFESKTLGNFAGLYTRVYSCVFLEVSWLGNLYRFLMLSNVLFAFVITFDGLDFADIISHMLTLVLTLVALLFVLPERAVDFTSTDILMIAQIIVVVLITFLIETDAIQSRSDIIMTVVSGYVLQIIFMVTEYRKYRKLVTQIKDTFWSNGRDVADAKDIDQLI